MGEPSFVIPDVVRARAAVDGDGGQGWVEALPKLLADLEDRWSVRIGDQLQGGTAAFVARARTASGAAVVVKITVPDEGFARQIRTLELADGRGYVRLLAHDSPHQAVMLEQLGLPMSQVGYLPEHQLNTLASVLTQVWALPRDGGAGSGAAESWPGEPVDKAASLHELVGRLWHGLDEPCPQRVIARALECAEQRSAAFDTGRAVVVHGDAATANLLQAPSPRPGAEAGFVFVDPDTFLGDPAYDLGVALRDWCPELLAGDAPALARRWSRLLASAGGLEEVDVWQWGYLERVSTGLYAMSFGADGRPHLLSADALCDAGPDR